MKLARLVLAVFALQLGCATRNYGSVSIVSTKPDSVRATVIERDVQGSHCRSGVLVLGDRLIDYGVAVQDALSSVSGADVLLDASVEFVAYDFILYQRWCARVSGTAAVLE